MMGLLEQLIFSQGVNKKTLIIHTIVSGILLLTVFRAILVGIETLII